MGRFWSYCFFGVYCACGVLFLSGKAWGTEEKKERVWIERQERAVISPLILERTDAENSWVKVSIAQQRAYLMNGEDVAIDTPVSTGKRNSTPRGEYEILEKLKDYRSNVYGNFTDASGRVVRRGVSVRMDSAPSGTHFVGGSITYWMRMKQEGFGMYVGELPGYPATGGGIRLPADIAPLIFAKVKLGTRVLVE